MVSVVSLIIVPIRIVPEYFWEYLKTLKDVNIVRVVDSSFFSEKCYIIADWDNTRIAWLECDYLFEELCELAEKEGLVYHSNVSSKLFQELP